MKVITPFYLDKALYMALVTPLSAFLARRFGVFLDVEEVVGISLPVVAYILGHKWSATQKAIAKQAADVAKGGGSAVNQ